MFVYREVTSSLTSNEFCFNLGTDFILQIKSVVSLTIDGKDFILWLQNVINVFRNIFCVAVTR